jgi:hypothetical protein
VIKAHQFLNNPGSWWAGGLPKDGGLGEQQKLHN